MADDLQITPQGEAGGAGPGGEGTFNLGQSAPEPEAPTETELPPIDPETKQKVLNAEVPEGLIGAETQEGAGAPIAETSPPVTEIKIDAPAEPEPETPAEAEPVAEAPAEPEPEAPAEAEPVTEAPAEPEPEAPAEAEPVAEAPAEPEPEASTVEPAPEIPAEEPKEAPAEPEIPEEGAGEPPEVEPPIIAEGAGEEPPKKRSLKLPLIIAGVIAVVGIVSAAVYFGIGTQLKGEVTGPIEYCPAGQYHPHVYTLGYEEPVEKFALFSEIAYAHPGHPLNCQPIPPQDCELMLLIRQDPYNHHVSAATLSMMEEWLLTYCMEYCPTDQIHWAPTLGQNTIEQQILALLPAANADVGHELNCQPIIRSCEWYEMVLDDPIEYHASETTLQHIRQWQFDECRVLCDDDYFFDIQKYPGQSPPDYEHHTYDGPQNECESVPQNDCNTLTRILQNPDAYFITDTTLSHIQQWQEQACACEEATDEHDRIVNEIRQAQQQQVNYQNLINELEDVRQELASKDCPLPPLPPDLCGENQYLDVETFECKCIEGTFDIREGDSRDPLNCQDCDGILEIIDNLWNAILYSGSTGQYAGQSTEDLNAERLRLEDVYGDYCGRTEDAPPPSTTERTISCDVNKTNVMVGESVTYTATFNEEHEGDEYKWHDKATQANPWMTQTDARHATYSTSWASSGIKKSLAFIRNNNTTVASDDCPDVTVAAPEVPPPPPGEECPPNEYEEGGICYCEEGYYEVPIGNAESQQDITDFYRYPLFNGDWDVDTIYASTTDRTYQRFIDLNSVAPAIRNITVTRCMDCETIEKLYDIYRASYTQLRASTLAGLPENHPIITAFKKKRDDLYGKLIEKQCISPPEIPPPVIGEDCTYLNFETVGNQICIVTDYTGDEFYWQIGENDFTSSDLCQTVPPNTHVVAEGVDAPDSEACREEMTTPPSVDLNLSCNVDKTSVFIGQSVMYSTTLSGVEESDLIRWQQEGQSATAMIKSSATLATKSKSWDTAGEKKSISYITRAGTNIKQVNCPKVDVIEPPEEETPPPEVTLTCTANKSHVDVGESVTYTSTFENTTEADMVRWQQGSNTSELMTPVDATHATISKSWNAPGRQTSISFIVRDNTYNIKQVFCPEVIVDEPPSEEEPPGEETPPPPPDCTYLDLYYDADSDQYCANTDYEGDEIYWIIGTDGFYSDLLCQTVPTDTYLSAEGSEAENIEACSSELVTPPPGEEPPPPRIPPPVTEEPPEVLIPPPVIQEPPTVTEQPPTVTVPPVEEEVPIRPAAPEEEPVIVPPPPVVSKTGPEVYIYLFAFLASQLYIFRRKVYEFIKK